MTPPTLLFSTTTISSPFFYLPIFFFSLLLFFIFSTSPSSSPSSPKSYPLIGALFSIIANKHRRAEWITSILRDSPSSTFLLHRPLGVQQIYTAHPPTVKHILKTNFNLYQKGSLWRTSLHDFLGHGIFNTDGDSWKYQRQLCSREFSTNSLRRFVQEVVDTELNTRLLPILNNPSSLLDLQDLLQRFAFDNICNIAFGHDPACLSPSLPHHPFASSFEEATFISSSRFQSVLPLLWKLKKLLNLGSEKRLRNSLNEIHDFARKVVREKKRRNNNTVEEEEEEENRKSDLLTLFLKSGKYTEEDDGFVVDMIKSFILAGRDTTSAALVWFFWLVGRNPRVEGEIVREIKGRKGREVYEEVKDMPYTHGALCESMRLYPPVPFDTKEVMGDDRLPCGRRVRRGMRITYCPYAMGRMEEIWGEDWEEYRPERWLEKEKEEEGGRWRFVGRDSYEYPVFQAGPRICLGKEMAFLQMKRVVAGVLGEFKVVAAEEKGQPQLIIGLTSKMKGGFLVRVERREEA